MISFKKHILDSIPYVGGSTREQNSGGKALHKLSSNENPLGPSPKALTAIGKALSSLHEYQFQDDQVFTEKLSEHFEGKLSHEQFLPANSGMELLDIICRGLLEPGTSCILSSPTFMAYKNFAELAGARVIDVPLLQETFSLNVPGILHAIDQSTRIIFIGNPNNPTGALFPERDIRFLLAGLPDHVVLVYDEVYHHFVDRLDYIRASDMITEGENVIGIHSFSKAYGLAGIRLGYLFSTPEITKYLRHFRRPFMISSLSMTAGIAALDDVDHISRTVRMTILEKKWLYPALKRSGICYYPSDSNFILIRPPVPAARFCDYMLRQGIMVRSAEPLGAPGFVRITVGDREMNKGLMEAIKSLQFSKAL
jgi:histidinol-phosphate aminotransferase